MGIFHTQAFNFKDWPFNVIVTSHFRIKCGHLNEKVYCKPVDRTLKCYLLRGQTALSDQSLLVIEVTGFWIKKHKYKKTLKIFSSKNKSFHNLHEVLKTTVLNTMAIDLW